MRAHVGVLLALVLLACEKTAPSSSGPSVGPPSATATNATDPSCGMRPSDWCPSPPGDPCGKYVNTDACRADKKCKGMPYQGESVVACEDDGSGFAKNCPTVGCISR